ncbi:DUF805 domain-containing protein [Diaminobutyricibacter tongyongensis]|uniref:DUF805 domain-containing protein n=1 Tax=Leifsonia tongyongensis TaxID=1268043 RepID=A0A6L9XVS8_9MICO|nr:DUF805 domain-containing protein [Diaminobutyricibacter tongyongensis]
MQPMGQPYQQPGAPVPDWAPYYGASFGVAFQRFFRKYADFTGRASRSELWWWVLAWVAIEFVINIIGNATGNMGAAMYRNGEFHFTPGYWLFASLSGLVWLATIVPWLAITWRRLHDANLAGPFFFLSLIPFAGIIILLVLLALPSNPQGARFDRPRTYATPPAAYPPAAPPAPPAV